MNKPPRKFGIDPNELDAQHRRDQAPAEITVPRNTSDKLPKAKSELHHDKGDRQALERGEDEGMIVRPG